LNTDKKEDAMFVLPMMTALLAAQIFPPVEALEERSELPDPFVFFDGRPVETPEQWMAERRPELKGLFQHYMYGFPAPAPAISVHILQEDDDVLDGAATMRQVEIRFAGVDEDGPKIRVALVLPKKRQGPVPVFVGINKCGNQEVLPDERILLFPEIVRHGACPEDLARGSSTDFWSVAYIIERGYGFAAFHESELDPDANDFSDGVHAAFPEYPHEPRHGWGTIAAWAWGFHRVVDYLVQDGDVDGERIAVVGHSRRGKTALLAAALDERIALCVPHQSGTGGMALSRDNDQETVERINRVFPHWFNGAFKGFSDNEARLPFDQHLLMALVAPRLLFATEGLQDTWANYESAWRGMEAAGKVYTFLGKEGPALVSEAPVTEENLRPMMQYRLDTKHTLNQDYWQAILDFADLQWR